MWRGPCTPGNAISADMNRVQQMQQRDKAVRDKERVLRSSRLQSGHSEVHSRVFRPRNRDRATVELPPIVVPPRIETLSVGCTADVNRDIVRSLHVVYLRNADVFENRSERIRLAHSRCRIWDPSRYKAGIADRGDISR